jgi:hypothetical protein
MVAKKAWMFPKSNKSFIEKVQTKFPDWKLTQIEQSEEQTEDDEVDTDF